MMNVEGRREIHKVCSSDFSTTNWSRGGPCYMCHVQWNDNALTIKAKSVGCTVMTVQGQSFNSVTQIRP